MAKKHASLATKLLNWYGAHRRALPWRTTAAGAFPDPWHVLVSEIMLQQTTVATVGPYFRRFIERFPDVFALASCEEGEVLRLWQGLGYYARARNLRAAAKKIVADFAGQVPSGSEELLSLPGVGRYTAGAVGSLAFGKRAPIVDANVARVICRLDRITADPRTPKIQRRLWDRAAEILPRKRVGDFNSALMELGGTVCRPKHPNCRRCPLKEFCRARAQGVQDEIPPAKKKAERPRVLRNVYCIHSDGRWLIEQRPVKGRWGAMWQFVTMAADDSLSRAVGLPVGNPKLIGAVDHQLTHRQYHFDVFLCESAHISKGEASVVLPRRWVTLQELVEYPKPRPHVKIATMIAESIESRETVVS